MSETLIAMRLLVSLAFFLVNAVHGKEIYISTPSASSQDRSTLCHQDCSSSLSQFSEGDECNGSDSNISLIFLPGNHSLDRELYLSGAYNLSLSAQTVGMVFIECVNQLGRLNIRDTAFVSMSGLHFVGCDGNSVSNITESLTVEDTIFQGVEGGGTALWLNDVSTASIIRSEFLFNGRQKHYNDEQDDVIGGALNIASSDVSIDSSHFAHNEAWNGSAIFIQNSSLSIIQSNFSYNRANHSGGVIYSEYSFININDSHFSTNSAGTAGGVIHTYNDSCTIMCSSFTNNHAISCCGGVIDTPYRTSFNISKSSFSGNNASVCGGVLAIALPSLLNITESNFSSNSAYSFYGGAICLRSLSQTPSPSHSSINIIGSSFTHNYARRSGGAIVLYNADSETESSFSIINSTFTHNNSTVGGVLYTIHGNYTISGSTISSNTGGVIFSYFGTFIFTDSNFIANIGQNYRGILFVFECSVEITNCTFDRNFGSLYTFSSNLTFRGNTIFENGIEQALLPAESQLSSTRNEGGAVTSFRSVVVFAENSTMSNNRARDGGAILAIESTVMVYGEMTLTNNTAVESNGGGISLRQSDLDVKGYCVILDYHAIRGGGIHSTSSSVSVHQPGILQCINNSAVNGSGMYLEVNSKLYVLRRRPTPTISEDLLIFEGNNASYAGGAIYVADETSSGSCLPNVECFIQQLALYPMESIYGEKNISIYFSDSNVAAEQGSNVFGGLLDRCKPSPFRETNQVNDNNNNANSSVTYLQSISNIESDTISSQPVRVCFCTNKGTELVQDCSYQPPPIKVKKGEDFTVSLVAVDQANHSVAANIISSVSGGFGEGQQVQAVQNVCTNLTYSIFSKQGNETVELYADGPCGSSSISLQELEVDFTDCTCAIGFMQSHKNPTKCECVCHMALSGYVTDCNSTSLFLKKNSTSWITYINYHSGYRYITHPNCPFGYCKTDVSINLNLPNGADMQCENNRRGILCGACQYNFSLSLGSTSCLLCPDLWPAAFVAIVLFAILAGVVLVIALLALNMTVAVGQINGFIFYVNIVAANSAVFFPSSKPSFPTVFIAWLNLDFGIDTCFLNGLDMYYKTWLQLAFPVYMIVLVILVIIISEYSPRFAALIGKRDPVATLATLILLSYAKLLSISINALSFATLEYPDGKRVVWLPDGNLNYFKGKHAYAVLAVVALLIVIVFGIPYTFSIFLWQWLVRAPRWKVFKWTRSTKFDAFVSTYHEPYNRNHRYWPGLLLLVRVVIYTTAAVTVSSDPQVMLLITILLVGGLFLFKAVIGVQVHKKSHVDILETALLLNLLVTAAFSLYHFQTDTEKQTAVAHVSTILTSILLLGVIGYRAFILINKSKAFRRDANVEYPLAVIQPKITQALLVLPSPPENGGDYHKRDEAGETIQDREKIIRETFTDDL